MLPANSELVTERGSGRKSLAFLSGFLRKIKALSVLGGKRPPALVTHGGQRISCLPFWSLLAGGAREVDSLHVCIKQERKSYI